MAARGICTYCMSVTHVAPCAECPSVSYCWRNACVAAQRLHVLTDKAYNAAAGLPYMCAPCGEAFDDQDALARHLGGKLHRRLAAWIQGQRMHTRYCDTCRRAYKYDTAADVRDYEGHLTRRVHVRRAKIKRLQQAMLRLVRRTIRYH